MTTAELSLPAPAKLNLSLRIVGRRADGLHLLSGTMILIDLQDTVVLTLRRDGRILCDWRHPLVEHDITVKAAKALQTAAGCLTLGVNIAVHKRIPIGGGLGGASSNAAAVLVGLNQLWRLNWHKEQLVSVAASLGADVPFFLHGEAAEISGIGDSFLSAKVKINNYLLAFPPIAALTAKVYAEYARLTNAKKIVRIPPPLDKSDNDLTIAAINLYPQIKQVAQALYDLTGEARLSGSGSTVYAAFADKAQAQQAQRRLPAHIRSAVVRLLPQHPLFSHRWGVAKW